MEKVTTHSLREYWTSRQKTAKAANDAGYTHALSIRRSPVLFMNQ